MLMLALLRGHLIAGHSDLLLIVIVVLLLLWGFGGRYYSGADQYGYGPRGYGIGWVIVLVVILLLFFGNPF